MIIYLAPMRYTLYINLSNPSATYREVPCNSGIEMVPPLLDELRRRGEIRANQEHRGDEHGGINDRIH